ncbi:fasciclin domain-containing protein [Rubrivirga litoralis]|uniref:Fasciclin domain-containing protein n=1 Tax=Rubrivirga litoralis TaxID=3075598 RepID=A0ABU3BNB9_9BACT|nr:fasciclin domain-containing protein [Rubrivirga sp. F394]MDT0630791.1 fasciclin domain-containing protein [Rubrivirga sp. F394]
MPVLPLAGRLRPARLAAFVVAAACLAACGAEPEPAPPPAGGGVAAEGAARPPAGPQTVLDVVAATPDLSTLAELVERADLGAVLRDTSQTITLFAPSDAAFAALPAGALDALRADPAATRALLLSHVVPTRLPAADVFAEIAFETPGGTDLTVDADDDAVTASGPGGAGRVTTADLDAANGVVHVVDAVLARPSAV